MRRLWLAIAAICFQAAAPAQSETAQSGKAGGFDYYVMSLSWSANWCSFEGDGRRDPQCDAGRGLT